MNGIKLQFSTSHLSFCISIRLLPAHISGSNWSKIIQCISAKFPFREVYCLYGQLHLQVLSTSFHWASASTRLLSLTISLHLSLHQSDTNRKLASGYAFSISCRWYMKKHLTAPHVQDAESAMYLSETLLTCHEILAHVADMNALFPNTASQRIPPTNAACHTVIHTPVQLPRIRQTRNFVLFRCPVINYFRKSHYIRPRLHAHLYLKDFSHILPKYHRCPAQLTIFRTIL